MDKGFLGGIRNRDLYRPSKKYNIPKAKKVREAIDPIGIQKVNSAMAKLRD